MRFAILAGAGMRRSSPQFCGGDVSIVNKDIYNAVPALIGGFEMLERSDLLAGIVILLARFIAIWQFKPINFFLNKKMIFYSKDPKYSKIHR
jgi:hypothetical protein